jgi:hypothetical protein
MSSASRSDISAIAQQDLTHAKKNPGFASRTGVEKSTKNQVVPDNERSAARKAKELIENGGSNEDIEAAIREAFTGVIVGMKDYIDNTKTNRGNKFNMRIRSVTVTDEDGRKRISISGQLVSKHLGEYWNGVNEDDIVGSFSRVMYFDENGAEVLHTDVTVSPPVQGFGVATALNARNEEIYRELGVSTISLYGNSASGRNGASHWPRNGYYWYDENEKNFFLDALSDDLKNTDKETRDKIKELLEKSRADKFGEGVTPEELLAWDDKGKALVGTEIRYRRDISKPSPTSFASRSQDFTTNTHNMEIDYQAPEADMFTADNKGRTIQVYVPEGVEVVNPRTGKKMILDSPDASTEFVADGGNLSEVPDMHLNSAILNNAEDVPGEIRSGWRFSKPGGRFEWVGGGGGATGMMRLRDKRTNALFGIKFEASFMAPDGDRYGEWTSPIPITDSSAADAPEGIINEVVGQAVIQALGFEPGATRIVRRSPRGAGDQNGGASMLVDFVQNRHRRVRDADDYAPMKVRRESAIRMLLLDAILANRDRNPQNFLTSIQSDGTRVIVPIDHGAIMTDRLNDFDLRWAVSHQMGFNTIEYERILDDMTRAELIAIMPGILADYRADIEQKKADIVKAMNEAVDKLISLHKDGDWPDMEYLESLYEEYNKRLKGVFSRLDEVASMSDEDFLDLFKYLRFGER